MTIRRSAASLLLSGLLACGSGAAFAQLRTIPPEAKSGKIAHVQEMIIAIDGKRKRLAPGAQIRDTQNRLVLPMSIPAGVRAKYLTDAEGMVRQVWILTPEEAAQSGKEKAKSSGG